MRPIDWTHMRYVAEFGAGTGVFTRQIQARSRSDCHAVIFEQDDRMRHCLREEFPDFSFHRDARELPQALTELSISGLDCIFSGLPFANFPAEVRDQILDQAWSALKPGGLFVMFQYSCQLKPRLQRQFTCVDTTFVPFNIPPAFVHVCRKHPVPRRHSSTSLPQEIPHNGKNHSRKPRRKGRSQSWEEAA